MDDTKSSDRLPLRREGIRIVSMPRILPPSEFNALGPPGKPAPHLHLLAKPSNIVPIGLFGRNRPQTDGVTSSDWQSRGLRKPKDPDDVA